MEDALNCKRAEDAPLLVPNRLGDNDGSRNDGVIPHLITSLPSFNEAAASYVTQTTSLITGCFSDHSVETDSGHSMHVQEKVMYSSTAEGECLSSSAQLSIVEGRPTSSEDFIDIPPIHDEISITSAGENCSLSVESNVPFNIVTATPMQNGIVAGTLERSSSDQLRSPLLGESSDSRPRGISLFRGLVERARRTVRGSADDIGWLQRDPEVPPVEDGTERFNKILSNIRHGIHMLPKSMVYLLIPGLFSNHGPLYFVDTKTYFSKMGLTCHIAKIHSEASVENNAREIKECIEEMYRRTHKRVVLLGHSKGGVDAAAALSLYWSELKGKVAGLALAQSPYGGSPIASDILRQGQLGDYVNVRKVMEILICKVIKGDMLSLEDLTYEKRREFLKKTSLPREVPVVSFHTEADTSPTALATLSQVAHAELPLVPTLLTAGPPTKLPVVMPLGAAMAACAQLLQTRYHEKSDGLVTCRDAEVPGSLVVKPKRKLDHAWMVYSSLKDEPLEPNAAQVCEALLMMLVELEQHKTHHDDLAAEIVNN